MTNHATLQGSNQTDGHITPFDAIKQTRPDGTEFWSARDLMPLMGYSAWRNFEVPLNRAMQSAEVQGVDVPGNFAESSKVAVQGKMAQADYHLTRFAAYLVAMNGDPNKPEVAAVQAYFAIQVHIRKQKQGRVTRDEQRRFNCAGGRGAHRSRKLIRRTPKGVQTCPGRAGECAGTVRGYRPYAGQGAWNKGTITGKFGKYPKLGYGVNVQKNKALAVLPTPQSVTELKGGVQYV